VPGVELPVPGEACNVLGESLASCSSAPMTGFFRTGCCDTGPQDRGLHVVCAQVTAEFLEFSRRQGNDLVTPMPAFQFPGPSAGRPLASLRRWSLRRPTSARWRSSIWPI
jgi:uncharacterized protein